MDRRFDLLGLPRLAFDHIYQHLRFQDIILLAACSKRTQSFLKAKEIFLSRTTSCEVFISDLYFNKKNLVLKDNSRFPNRETLRMRVWNMNHPLFNDLYEQQMQITVGGSAWQIHYRCGSWQIYSEASDAIVFWFGFVKETFCCRLTISIELNENRVRQFNELYKTDVLHVAHKMHLDFRWINNRQMKHILDNVEAEELELRAYPHYKFRYDKVITRIPNITLTDPYWLKMKMVWKMVKGGVRVMDFGWVSWKSEKFNKFIKKWLKSTNKTLEVIRFHFRDEFYDPRKVFKKIKTIPGSKKRQDATTKYFRVRIDYEKGQDIRRADGVLATIVLQGKLGDCFRSYYSTFTVWNDPNPNL